MFNKKENDKGNSRVSNLEMVSTIAAGMVVRGDINADGDIRIDGRIEGNLYCKGRVVLGPSGQIEGDLKAENADVFGLIHGVVRIKDLLCLKNNCEVNGNIYVGRLNIEPMASFNGQCKMNADKQSTAVKEVNSILANTN